MQLFHIISVVVPILIIFLLPYGLKRIGYVDAGKRWILLIACALFFISWYLPSPLVDGRDMSLVTHVVGGGVFTGVLWLYLISVIRPNWSVGWEITSLFALVSSLGVINELFEFFLVHFEVASILITDTSWDLVANTTGAFVVLIAYRVGRLFR